jgi:ligand-binding sensor domain-containing protein/two-component sensor histidine kinase
MCRLIASLCFLLFCMEVKTQFNDGFTNCFVSGGLPDNYVNSILQDSRGFMWFGTREGLSRYDGANFRNFFARKNDSTALPGNNIHCLTEYKPGQLLFIASGKLTVLNTITQQFHQPKQALRKTIYNLNRAGNNAWFIAGTDTCLVINSELDIVDTLLPPLKKKGQMVNAYILDDTTWLTGSHREYFIYHTKERKFEPFPLQTSLPPQRQFLAFHYYDKKNKQLYFSSFWGGLYRYALTGRLLMHWGYNPVTGLTNTNIAFVHAKSDSILWVGTYGGGLHILNTRTAVFKRIVSDKMNPRSLPGNIIIMNYTDRDMNEWIATSEGVGKINSATTVIKSWQTAFRQLSGDISLLHVKKGNDGNMYVTAYARNHVYKINPATNQLTLLNPSLLPGVWCLNTFGNELMFTGGGTAVTTFNPLTGQYTQTDFLKKYFPTAEAVVLAFKHSNGDEWYSGNNGGGFVRISAKDGTVHSYKKDGPNGKFSINYYLVHVEDKDGNLWFGVNKTDRLLCWNKQTDRFTEIQLNAAPGMSGQLLSGVSDITIDGNNHLWVAFEGAGLIRYDIGRNHAAHYTIQDGLPTNFIYSLQFDNKNRLWIGTTKGLSCFLVEQKKFVNFSKEDGLPDDYFSEPCVFFDSAANKLWIGTATTLMTFDPDVLLGINKKKLPIYIDAITVNGKSYITDNTGNITFRAGQNNLQFYFIAVDIDKGKDIEYSYQLTDQDWVYNGDIATASFANLSPGKYLFTVKAKHKGDNEWTMMQSRVAFIITPHWWQTWWFKLLVLLSIGLLIFAFIKAYFTRQLQKQKVIMEKELAIEQERTRMARELHDGLGSMLSGIKYSFSSMQKHFELNESQQLKFRSNIDKLNESIKELRNISHSMTSDSLLKYGLENALRDYCHNITQTGGLSVSFTALQTQQLPLSEEQAFHIFRIVQELLSNIMKHAATDAAIVQISYHAKRLFIAVEDSGKGFELKNIQRKGGMGLKNIESRIKILKGRMDYRTEPDQGTSVLIDIPCTKTGYTLGS